MKKSPIILDCTLRDGSYLNNYNFSPNITLSYLKKIQHIKVNYCEIGHGLGIGAYRNKSCRSKVSDQKLIDKLKYLKKKKTKIGFFAQPKFLNDFDLELIKNSEIDFLRIGVIPENYKMIENVVQKLKNKKIEIFAFFMQSFRDRPKSLQKKITQLNKNLGLKNFYIVDSTGSMNFDEIKQYFESIKLVNDNFKVGFHGHNNMGIANYNSFRCIEEGFDFVDGTFMGVGRGAGNSCYEHLILNYKKKLKLNNNDILSLLKFSNYFQKMIKIETPSNSHNTLCGILKIHEQNKVDFAKIKSMLNDKTF